MARRHADARLLLAAALVLAVAVSAARAADKPNFIIFYADDLGYGDLGVQGHPTIESPNIDRLAHLGMRFTNLYAGAPICSPSRASLMTGRLPVRNGVYTSYPYPVDLEFRVFYPWSSGGLPVGEMTMAELLKPQGYTSAIVGKWHLGHANDTLPTEGGGFDYWFGLPYSQDEGCPPGYNMTCTEEWQEIWPGIPLYENTDIIEQPVNLETYTPRMNDKAISFVEDAVDNDTPFLLYMAYSEVHVPVWASKNFTGLSSRGLFGDAILEMDDSVGQIVSLVSELGIDDNTLIVFTSDNGPWPDQGVDGGSAGLLKGEKGSTFEGGMREPAIFVWPGVIPEGTRNQGVASQMDLFQTFAELAGADVPTDRIYDGVSLVDTLTNGGTIDRDFLYYYRDQLIYAVRYGDYKAHFITRSGFSFEEPTLHDPPLLFNLQHDPGEHYELNTTLYWDTVVQPILDDVDRQNAAMVQGPPEIDYLDPRVTPCCDQDDDCVCGYGDDTGTTERINNYIKANIV